jgi:hypothetical protein
VFGTAAGVIGTITVALQLVLGLLALATHRQMGWRTYSRCAADVREKDAFKMRRLYLDIHKFTTALKMDLMVTPFSPLPPLFMIKKCVHKLRCYFMPHRVM